MSIADILERAADLIEPEGAWTQEAGCRDEYGNDLDMFEAGYDDRLAVCWCASEAIYRISGTHFTACPAHQFMSTFVGGHIPDWNDAPERTQAEVVAKLREAAALARDRDRSANADRREAAGPEGQEPGPKASPNLPHDHITRKAQP